MQSPHQSDSFFGPGPNSSRGSMSLFLFFMSTSKEASPDAVPSQEPRTGSYTLLNMALTTPIARCVCLVPSPAASLLHVLASYVLRVSTAA